MQTSCCETWTSWKVLLSLRKAGVGAETRERAFGRANSGLVFQEAQLIDKPRQPRQPPRAEWVGCVTRSRDEVKARVRSNDGVLFRSGRGFDKALYQEMQAALRPFTLYPPLNTVLILPDCDEEIMSRRSWAGCLSYSRNWPRLAVSFESACYSPASPYSSRTPRPVSNEKHRDMLSCHCVLDPAGGRHVASDGNTGIRACAAYPRVLVEVTRLRKDHLKSDRATHLRKSIESQWQKTEAAAICRMKSPLTRVRTESLSRVFCA